MDHKERANFLERSLDYNAIYWLVAGVASILFCFGIEKDISLFIEGAVFLGFVAMAIRTKSLEYLIRSGWYK